MKRRILGVLATLGLALTASFVVGADPASAHNWDSLSYSSCQAIHSEWTSSSYTTHSHPTELTEAYVDYRCCFDLYGLSHRWANATRWWNGLVTDHAWGAVLSGWCP